MRRWLELYAAWIAGVFCAAGLGYWYWRREAGTEPE